jgi:ATP-binding cassette, subfamily B, bacterial
VSETTLVIADRLSTVVNASSIVILKDGHIVEQGTRAQLMHQGGYYASLVARQSRGLIANDADPSGNCFSQEHPPVHASP